MKLKIRRWSIIWRYLLTVLVVYLIIFSCCLNIFIDVFTKQFIPWDFRQPLLISLIAVVSIIAIIPTLKNNYYTIENSTFIVKKMNKEYEFSYSNVEYIDYEASNRRHKVIFYVKNAKWQYLIPDKENKLIKTLEKKCKNVLSKEDFLRVHPEER